MYLETRVLQSCFTFFQGTKRKVKNKKQANDSDEDCAKGKVKNKKQAIDSDEDSSEVNKVSLSRTVSTSATFLL